MNFMWKMFLPSELITVCFIAQWFPESEQHECNIPRNISSTPKANYHMLRVRFHKLDFSAFLVPPCFTTQ